MEKIKFMVCGGQKTWPNFYMRGYGYPPGEFEQTIKRNYSALVHRYGEKKIKENFPGEALGLKLFEKIEEIEGKEFESDVDDFEERDYSKIEPEDWDDEIRKMDDETGGSWRTENDVG
jgi:hypothetical protein